MKSSNDETADSFDEQINVKLPFELKLRLYRMYKRHGIQTTELLRKLGEEAVNFSEKHGYFSFPLTIKPTGNPAQITNPEYIAAHSDEIDTNGGKTPKLNTPGDTPKLKQRRSGIRRSKGRT